MTVSYHEECPPYIGFGPPDVVLSVTWLPSFVHTKGIHSGSRIRPASRFIISLLCWISRAFSRTLLLSQLSPSKEFLLLPVDGMCSLLNMHGDSIVKIVALHHPLVLHHTDLQRLTNIATVAARELSTQCPWHSQSSIHFREGFPEGIPGREGLPLYPMACTLCWSSRWSPWCMAGAL